MFPPGEVYAGVSTVTTAGRPLFQHRKRSLTGRESLPHGGPRQGRAGAWDAPGSGKTLITDVGRLSLVIQGILAERGKRRSLRVARPDPRNRNDPAVNQGPE
jgi:hypothetical protein